MVQDKSKNIKTLIPNAQNNFFETLASIQKNVSQKKNFNFEIENFEEEKNFENFGQKSRLFRKYFLKVWTPKN